MSSSDRDLIGMAEVGYYRIGPLSDVLQWYGAIKILHASKSVINGVIKSISHNDEFNYAANFGDWRFICLVPDLLEFEPTYLWLLLLGLGLNLLLLVSTTIIESWPRLAKVYFAGTKSDFLTCLYNLNNKFCQPQRLFPAFQGSSTIFDNEYFHS